MPGSSSTTHASCYRDDAADSPSHCRLEVTESSKVALVTLSAATNQSTQWLVGDDRPAEQLEPDECD